jgi:hypothetical protein
MQCLNCGIATPNPKFCSRTCAAQYNNRQFPKREKRKFFCRNCGAETEYRRQYCDSCSPKDGADWSKRTLAFVRSFLDFHARIRQLARRTYSGSGNPQQCVNCGYSKHVQICHIRAIQDFPDDTPISVINSPENLVALCPNCHWELDHGLLDLSARKR